MAWMPLVKGLHIAATVLLAGALAFELLVVRGAGTERPDGEAASRAMRWLRLVAACASAAALASWVAWLVCTAVAMTGLPADQALQPATLQALLAHTAFGKVWSIRLGLLVLLGALLLRRGPHARSGAAWGVAAAALAACLAGSLAWAGHALGSRPPHLFSDLVHLLAASVWLGMLLPLLLVLHRAAQAPAPWLAFASVAISRFSLPAMAAVAALAATGAVNTWWMVRSAADLTGTGYGLLVLGKAGLFAAMVALALVNRLVLTPRIAGGSAAALKRLRSNVVAELLLGAGVLALVAILGTTAPAAH